MNMHLLAHFVGSLRTILSLDKTLIINASTFTTVDVENVSSDNTTCLPHEISGKLNGLAHKYDLLFELLPFGLKSIANIGNIKNMPMEYEWIFDSLKFINSNGYFLTLMPNGILFSLKGKLFQQILAEQGFCFSAVFSLPANFLYPDTSVSTNLILINSINAENVFISEINNSTDFSSLIINYKNGYSSSLTEGLFISKAEFSTIENYKIAQQIRSLKSQYNNYIEYRIKDIIYKPDYPMHSNGENDNSIYYCTNISANLTILSSKEVMNRKEYIQLFFKPEIVYARYLEIFFKSALGLLILKLPKNNFDEIIIPIPDISTQKLMIATTDKLVRLKNSISVFESELSLNQNNAKEIDLVLSKALESIEKLNEEEQVLNLIRQGESKTLEFKASFSKDVIYNRKEKENEIRESSLKNIVAFLNTDGGTLLIGVTDKGEILGIENDNYENDDKYLLNFKDVVKDHIGSNYSSFVDWQIVNVFKKKILMVDCKKSTSNPFYLDKTKFFIRTNPSAEKLEGIDLFNYLKERFNHD